MRARGVAHSTSDAKTVTVHVPTSDLVRQLEKQQKEGLRWKDAFSNYPEYMSISYEEFTRDKDQSVSNILSFLEMEPAVSLKSDLVKLNTAPLSEIITNFDEVRDCLADTPFAWCIAK